MTQVDVLSGCCDEHIYIKNSNPKSSCAMHILNNWHEYGRINSMNLLRREKGIRLK